MLLLKNKTDKIIWKNFIDEGEEALSFIYHQNVDFLFYYGKKFTANEALILDVIQDLFFYLISKRQTLGETDNIRIYLLIAFRRRLFDKLKKENRQHELEQEYEQQPQIVFSVEEQLIMDEEALEKKQELRRSLEKLSVQQREVLYYRFTCGFDYQQICTIMSISYDAARQMVSRSIQQLRKSMVAKGFMFTLLFFRRLK